MINGWNFVGNEFFSSDAWWLGKDAWGYNLSLTKAINSKGNAYWGVRGYNEWDLNAKENVFFPVCKVTQEDTDGVPTWMMSHTHILCETIGNPNVRHLIDGVEHFYDSMFDEFIFNERSVYEIFRSLREAQLLHR